MNHINLIVIFLLILFAGTIIYLATDYFGPKNIGLRPDNKFGLDCLRARDLVVQEFDKNGNLWATRGLLIYCLRNGDVKFKKAFHLNTGFSHFWFNNFTFVRKYMLRAECIEMTISDNGSICAFTSGAMWNKTENEKKFRKTFILPNYGISVGRGIMSTGLSFLSGEDFVFGEYFSNSQKTAIKIYRYLDYLKEWNAIYEFPPGQIRHIHSLQKDPYTGRFWVCTGDEDQEPMIGWSDDEFKSVNPIGRGSQKWRACQLVFTEDAVYWGADTGSEEHGGIYKWDKKTEIVKQLQRFPGAIFYGTRLSTGHIIMSTDRESFPNERDDKTRFLIIDESDNIREIEGGSWNYQKKGIRFNFAKLRLQRTQGNHLLAVSCLNLKEIPDGDLLIFDEYIFNKISSRK